MSHTDVYSDTEYIRAEEAKNISFLCTVRSGSIIFLCLVGSESIQSPPKFKYLPKNTIIRTVLSDKICTIGGLEHRFKQSNL